MSTQHTPKFQEEYSAKLPAMALFANLGWSFLNPTQALVARGDKADKMLLRNLLRAELACLLNRKLTP